MTAQNEITLTLHGLDVDNGLVRAEIFLEKLRALLSSLKVADKDANGKKSHNYIVTGLEIGSAKAQLREKVAVKKHRPDSSVGLLKDVVNAVYLGDKNIERFSDDLIQNLAPLVKSVGKSFSHGEIGFNGDNIVRIDDYLAQQFAKVAARKRGDEEQAATCFEGIAMGTFDGVIQELDSRGTLVRGKLTLTAGGKEIDCVFRREDIALLRESFDTRARVEAVAHYDGESLLPVRLDVRTITVVKPTSDLTRWKGRLKRTSKPVDWNS